MSDTHPTPLYPNGTLKRSRNDTYEHTINGLLTKRVEMFTEAERLRDRLAGIKNDIAALDRTLVSFGYTGDLDSMMPRPRQKAVILFAQSELLQACLRELRYLDRPMTSREIAVAIIRRRGEDPNDRKYSSDMTRRVSKCLRRERASGTVHGERFKGRYLIWSII